MVLADVEPVRVILTVRALIGAKINNNRCSHNISIREILYKIQVKATLVTE